MEEDDEIRSHHAGSPSKPPEAAGNGRIGVDFDGGAPQSSLTLALPIQQSPATAAAPVAGGGGGGREDCWSDGSTGVLIGAWGERYLELNRGNLKEKHWKEVAEIVSGGGRTKPPRSQVQCKYRIDTVKRKYKLEKGKAAAGNGPTKWAFFDTMDRIIGPVQAHNPSAARPDPIKPRRQSQPPDAPARLSQPQPQPLRAVLNSDSDTESDKLADFLARSPPPLPQPPAARLVDRKMGADEGQGKGMGELTRAVQRFVEVYERAEMMKMGQAMEIEKQRMRLAKEMEVQRMQLMMTAQVELTKMRRRPRRPRQHDQEKRSGGSGSGSGSNRN